MAVFLLGGLPGPGLELYLLIVLVFFKSASSFSPGTVTKLEFWEFFILIL